MGYYDIIAVFHHYTHRYLEVHHPLCAVRYQRPALHRSPLLVFGRKVVRPINPQLTRKLHNLLLLYPKIYTLKAWPLCLHWHLVVDHVVN